MTVEEALLIVEQIHELGRLSKVQEAVFRQAWEGRSYQEIADATSYDPGYIKEAGSKLWQMLSEALGEHVTKQNFIAVLKRSQLLATSGGIAAPPSTTARYQDWGEAPDVSVFFGRNEELERLKQWVSGDHCRLVAILGMGGMGKTALSVKLAEQLQGDFEVLVWRSLRNTPSLDELLVNLLRSLAQADTPLSETQSGKLTQLMDHLRQTRSLIVLDNFEALYSPGERVGTYRAGYEGYGELLKHVGEIRHQSCLVLTSREQPRELAFQEGERLPIRCLGLTGLQVAEGREIFHVKGSFSGTASEWKAVIQHYGGNPLALKMVASGISYFLDGNISRLIELLEKGILIFRDIRDILERQFSRLSELEQQLMYWLAINREPVSLEELQADLVPKAALGTVIENITTLEQRSLIEKVTVVQSKVNSNQEQTVTFTQQPAVMEYVTERFVTHAVSNLTQLSLDASTALLNRYTLLKATANNYVRGSQVRVIIEPLIDQAIAKVGIKTLAAQLYQQLHELASVVREHSNSFGDCAYLFGNLLNLCNHLQIDLTGFDFSHLTVWQAYLADVKLHQVNFAYVDLTKSVFAETFGGISCVALNPDDCLLATSDTGGAVQIWEVDSGKQLQAFKADIIWSKISG